MTGTSLAVTGLSSNTTYAYNVVASDAAGNTSTPSNTVNPTTTGGSGAGEIAAYYFETGFDGWSDGGSDCARVFSPDRSYEGSYSIRIRDNSSTSNSVSPALDLSGNSTVTIEFHTYSNSMELGEDFFVEFFNGSSYEVIGNYARGTDFNNDEFFTDNIVLNAADYNFNGNNRIRFRCDASGNGDRIYFDQVIISGDNVQSASAPGESDKTPATILKSFTKLSKENIKLYPNPANSEINIDIQKGSFDEIMVFSSTGEIIYRGEEGVNQFTIDVSKYTPGMYFVRFVSNGLAVTKRFVKK